MTITDEKFIRMENGRSLVLAELRVSAASELPARDGIPGRTLSEGSLAWDIGGKTMYGLKSDGTWVNQGDE